MKSKEELKKLFENGDKPTQEEFWEWQDSYWHKSEKLPIETAGLYKIKGSVPDLTTLNYMSNMSEGDVYNVIETGDNYVYVLDLDSTGSAGWDKLSGIIDLSTINLQTVLENGNSATSPNAENLIAIDIVNGIVSSSLSDSWSGLSSTLNQAPAYISFDSTQNNGNPKGTNFNQTPSFIVLSSQKDDLHASLTFDSLELLKYNEDYSSRYTNRTLVDKGYVDSNNTLQNVLENGTYAVGGDINTIMLDPNTSFGAYYADVDSGSYTSLGVGSNDIKLEKFNGIENTLTRITLDGGGLLYHEDYAQRPEFGERNLVDKGYVDNAISQSTPNVALTDVINNGDTATNLEGNNTIQLSTVQGQVNFGFIRDDIGYSAFTQFGIQGISSNYNSSNYQVAQQIETQSGQVEFYVTDKTNSTSSIIKLKADSALTYGDDYSSKFVDRSLVDKGYVDNATSTLNYLPLSGTEIGKPLTGNIALSYANFISGSNGYNSRLDFSGDSVELYSTTPMFTNSVRVSSDAVVLRSNAITNPGSYAEIYVREGLIRIATAGSGARGLTGDDDYTANITALDYVQKKYVDDAIANFTTPIEEIVLAGSNGLTGKIRYEKRGEFMNIHVDITVGELQVDESFSTILPFDLKTSFIVHPMITDIVNYFYTDIIIKTDGNDLLFINKTDAVITGGLIKQSFVFALGAD